MSKYSNLIKKAMQELENNDELFIEMINELDSWDGFADGYKCYPMSELDDMNYGKSASDFLNELTKDFNINDKYFYYSIYGLESTNDVADLYKTNTSAGEVLDNIIENYNHLYFSNKDFENLIEDIVNYSEE